MNTVAVQASTGNILVGGYNMQVQGDTTHAYHLIRLNSTWTYDSAYSTANPARALPGGIVNAINLCDANFPNQARIFGTLPKVRRRHDYMELTGTDLSTIVAGLGSGQFDGPIFGMAPIRSRRTVGDLGELQDCLWDCHKPRRAAEIRSFRPG